jgi:hypothetical protein
LSKGKGKILSLHPFLFLLSRSRASPKVSRFNKGAAKREANHQRSLAKREAGFSSPSVTRFTKGDGLASPEVSHHLWSREAKPLVKRSGQSEKRITKGEAK